MLLKDSMNNMTHLIAKIKINLVFSCDEFNQNYRHSFSCMNRQCGDVDKLAQERGEQLVQGTQKG